MAWHPDSGVVALGIYDVLPDPAGAPAFADCAYVNAVGTAKPSEVVAGRAELPCEHIFA